MGEVAAGGGDGAAGVEIATLSCRKAERFFDFVVARPKTGRGNRRDHSTTPTRARTAHVGDPGSAQNDISHFLRADRKWKAAKA